MTPRFVPSCTDEGLAGLGQLAQNTMSMYNPIAVKANGNTITSWNDLVKPTQKSCGIFGLLGEKAVMAHCNFIDEKDGEIFVETGTAVAHCPISMRTLPMV